MILADGCFDPLHIGHIRYLQAARKLGRPLCVAIAPDAVIEAKGRKPFQTQLERAETVLALDAVDMVRVCHALPDTIRELKPRIVVKGMDWKGRLSNEIQAACQAVGAEIVYLDTVGTTSTERLHGG